MRVNEQFRGWNCLCLGLALPTSAFGTSRHYHSGTSSNIYSETLARQYGVRNKGKMLVCHVELGGISSKSLKEGGSGGVTVASAY